MPGVDSGRHKQSCTGNRGTVKKHADTQINQGQALISKLKANAQMFNIRSMVKYTIHHSNWMVIWIHSPNMEYTC